MSVNPMRIVYREIEVDYLPLIKCFFLSHLIKGKFESMLLMVLIDVSRIFPGASTKNIMLPLLVLALCLSRRMWDVHTD